MTNKPLKKEQVKREENQEDQCFVIMPISSQNGYDEDHFQLVYEDIIRPSIIASNLKPFRADETKNTKLIKIYKDILSRLITKYEYKVRLDYKPLVNFKTNKSIPIHSWYDYKQGYARDLVAQIIIKQHCFAASE